MIKLIIFGTGSGAVKVINSLEGKTEIIAYCDNNKAKWGNEFNSKKIISPDEINNYSFEYIIIASSYYVEIKKQLVNMGIDDKKIIEFFGDFQKTSWLKKIKVGISNEINRDTWVKEKLNAITKGARILDAGAGEQKYKKYCTHLNYVSQDFAQYNGSGNTKGLQTNTWNMEN